MNLLEKIEIAIKSVARELPNEVYAVYLEQGSYETYRLHLIGLYRSLDELSSDFKGKSQGGEFQIERIPPSYWNGKHWIHAEEAEIPENTQEHDRHREFWKIRTTEDHYGHDIRVCKSSTEEILEMLTGFQLD